MHAKPVLVYFKREERGGKKKTGLSLWENGLHEEAKELDIVSTTIAPLKMTSSPRKTSFRPMHDGEVGGKRIKLDLTPVLFWVYPSFRDT